jgi:hypothetical protein
MYRQYVEECNAKGKPSSKEWLFRKVFNEEFNLSFKQPEVDTCDTYDSFKMKLQIMSMTEDERSAVDEEKKCHLEEASKRYRLKS